MIENITPLILTLNEASNISRSLQSLNWAKRIVIIDSYSTDETLEILGSYPQVEVFQRKFDTHTMQWNYGLEKVTSEWVLSLDADYILTKELINEIQNLSLETSIEGYFVRFKYCIFGKPLRGSLLPRRQVLYRKAKAIYIDDGHTQLLKVKGESAQLSFYIYHDDRKPLSRWLAAQDNYMVLEVKKLLKTPESELSFGDRIRKEKILAPFIIFFYCLILKGGIFDGWLILAFIATELTLRLAFGFGNPILSQVDLDTGYRFVPNQKVYRFGKTVEYNQYSQRSEPITVQKPKGVLRILMTGDSILNGGNPTDQKQTITEIFKSKLSASGYPAQVLNASAGSWGIGNELAYLRKFGLFNSDAVILEIGTNDLPQPTSTSIPVGKDPAFPDHRPLLAIQEVWSRYAWPTILAKLHISSRNMDFPVTPQSDKPRQQFKKNMEDLERITQLVRMQKVPLFAMFVPELYNLVPKDNPPQYKDLFVEKVKSLNIPLIDIELAWSSLAKNTVKTYFRDGIHPNEIANQKIANFLFQKLCIERLFH
jgi:glycosyltransferase involved in cell wall biosynthesis